MRAAAGATTAGSAGATTSLLTLSRKQNNAEDEGSKGSTPPPQQSLQAVHEHVVTADFVGQFLFVSFPLLSPHTIRPPFAPFRIHSPSAIHFANVQLQKALPVHVPSNSDAAAGACSEQSDASRCVRVRGGARSSADSRQQLTWQTQLTHAQ